MSITNMYQPSDKGCIYDGVWWTAISDSVGEPNFKYVFDVFDADGNQLIRAKVFPDPSNSRGYFDAAGVLKNAVDVEYLTLNSLSFYQDVLNNTNNLKIEYQVQVGEEYNVDGSGITILNDVSATTFAYNSINDLWRKGNDYVYAATDVSGVTTPYGYVTNRPFYTNSKYQNEPIFIGCHIKYTSFPVDYYNKFTFRKYNAAGTLIATTNDVYELNPGEDYYMLVNIGVEGVNNVVGAGWINSDVAYYTVQVGKDVFRVNLECDGYHELYTLTFLNSLGIYDTARFSCVSKLNMNVTRKSFEKRDVTFGDYGVSYKYDRLYNESKVNFDGVIDWTLKLTMDYPTDDEYEWLSELIYSTKVFLSKYVDGQVYHYPCTIKNSNYEYIKRLSSKLKTLEVEVEIGQKRNQIRR